MCQEERKIEDDCGSERNIETKKEKNTQCVFD